MKLFKACVAGGALCAALTFSAGGQAATIEQAMAQCRERFTPLIRDCVRQKIGGQRGASPEQYIPGCKAQYMGQIKSCVAGLMGAAGLANNPLDAAKSQAPTNTAAANAARRTTPPRTIADITAVLDQE